MYITIEKASERYHISSEILESAIADGKLHYCSKQYYGTTVSLLTVGELNQFTKIAQKAEIKAEKKKAEGAKFPGYLTVAELVEKYGISKTTINKAVRKGKIPASALWNNADGISGTAKRINEKVFIKIFQIKNGTYTVPDKYGNPVVRECKRSANPDPTKYVCIKDVAGEYGIPEKSVYMRLYTGKFTDTVVGYNKRGNPVTFVLRSEVESYSRIYTTNLNNTKLMRRLKESLGDVSVSENAENSTYTDGKILFSRKDYEHINHKLRVMTDEEMEAFFDGLEYISRGISFE